MPQEFDLRNWNQLLPDDQAALLGLLVEAGLLDQEFNVTATGERYLYTGALELPELSTFEMPVRLVEAS